MKLDQCLWIKMVHRVKFAKMAYDFEGKNHSLVQKILICVPDQMGRDYTKLFFLPRKNSPALSILYFNIILPHTLTKFAKPFCWICELKLLCYWSNAPKKKLLTSFAQKMSEENVD